MTAQLACKAGWGIAAQVMEWTQQILQIGKAFSGAEQTSLQDVLARQSGKFFYAFHSANLQVQQSRQISEC